MRFSMWAHVCQCRTQYIIFYGAMVCKILFCMPKIAHYTYKGIGDSTFCRSRLGRVILDNKVFNFCQFVCYPLIIMLMFIIETCVFMFYMCTYFVHKLVIAAQYKPWKFGGRVSRNNSFN